MQMRRRARPFFIYDARYGSVKQDWATLDWERIRKS